MSDISENKVDGASSPVSRLKAYSSSKAAAASPGGAAERYRADFDALMESSIDDQLEFFLKKFIFMLGDDWKQVVKLSNTFQNYLDDHAEKADLDAAQAADLLQKQNGTRTAIERRAELRDVDLNNDDRIGFTEFLLLTYKVDIMREFFTQRPHLTCPAHLDLTEGASGVGVTGVGEILLTALFHVPTGLAIDPALLAAIDAFMARKKARDTQVKTLTERSTLPGVKGLAAKNELFQLTSADTTEMNRAELTLNAAKRKALREAAKAGGVPTEDAQEQERKRNAALAERKAAEEQLKQDKAKQSRNKLKARAAMFE